VADMLTPDTNTEDDNALAASAAAVSSDSDALSYLWAQKRIEHLTNYGLNKNNPDIKVELTELGLTYSILTPYTSFIAVLDTVRNPDGNATDTDQPLPLPLEVSNFALGGYLFGSEPTDFLLPTALVLLLLLQFLHRRKTAVSNR
ncbi:MAG: trypsin, partial [Lachnospiraceae bacterium]|nr:trypsin [Lachnospiraceae bacterium]